MIECGNNELVSKMENNSYITYSCENNIQWIKCSDWSCLFYMNASYCVFPFNLLSFLNYDFYYHYRIIYYHTERPYPFSYILMSLTFFPFFPTLSLTLQCNLFLCFQQTNQIFSKSFNCTIKSPNVFFASIASSTLFTGKKIIPSRTSQRFPCVSWMCFRRSSDEPFQLIIVKNWSRDISRKDTSMQLSMSSWIDSSKYRIKWENISSGRCCMHSWSLL